MSHVRTTLRSYRVKNPAEFPLLVRRLADDHRSGEQFLADRIGASVSDLLRPSSPNAEETFRWAFVRHRLLDGIIRYLAAHLSSRLPDSDLMPLERLAERIRETRLLPGIELREATEETILDLTESLLHYHDLLSPEVEEVEEEKEVEAEEEEEKEEAEVEEEEVEEEEKEERAELLKRISELVKRRSELPSGRSAKRFRRIGGQTLAMSGALDESL